MLEPMTELPIKFSLGFFNSVALEKAVEHISSEIWGLSLDELTEIAKPTEKDKDLKFRFWKLSQDALFNHTEHTLGKLHEGICSYTHLYNNFLNNPYKVAWLLKQNSDRKAEIESLQHSCIDHLKDIVSLDLYRKDGSINHTNINLIIKAMKIVFAVQDRK